MEMQTFFIKTRDELCKNGELLLTPALSYTERHLSQALEQEQKDKQELEKQEEEEKRKVSGEEKLSEEKMVRLGQILYWNVYSATVAHIINKVEDF